MSETFALEIVLAIFASLFMTVFMTGCRTGIGSENSPFTELSEATTVDSNGYYYFKIFNNGRSTKFRTFVDNTNNRGWILFIKSGANANEICYKETEDITANSYGILNRNVVLNNINIESVRISGKGIGSESNDIDVFTQNKFFLDNLKGFRSLSQNAYSLEKNESLIPADAWVGKNSNNMIIKVTPTSGDLNQVIYHASGNLNGLHWHHDPKYGKIWELLSAPQRQPPIQGNLFLWISGVK